MERNFTFVTDCAEMMRSIFSASASPDKVAYNGQWVECISNQLNMAMKKEIFAVNGSYIDIDLTLNMNIITLFKKWG